MTASTHQLAVLELIETGGSTAEEAERLIAAFPEQVSGLAASARVRLEAQVKDDEARAYAQSPEGRREAAKAAVAALAERNEEVAAARVLLSQEGQLVAEEIAELSDVDALRAAGIEKTPYNEMGIQDRDRYSMEVIGKWPTMTQEERTAVVSETGTPRQTWDEASGFSSAPVAAEGEGEES